MRTCSTTCSRTRCARRLALADGDNAAAERWARSAVEYAQRTDFSRHTAYVRLDLARVLVASARPDEAADEARAALVLYQAKGDLPGVAEASEVLKTAASRRT